MNGRKESALDADMSSEYFKSCKSGTQDKHFADMVEQRDLGCCHMLLLDAKRRFYKLFDNSELFNL